MAQYITPTLEQSLKASPDPAVPRKHSRVRTGCITCRRRRKKCDEVKPRCAGCRRNQIPCEWPASTQIDTHWPALLVPTPLTFYGHAFKLTPDSARILAHYLGATSQMLTMMPTERNPFVTHIMPLAHADDLILHGVLALSGTHLIFGEGSSGSVQLAALSHYSMAIRGLRSELSQFDPTQCRRMLKLLLILILLCHYDVLTGDTKGTLFRHLPAARQLILHLLPLSQDSSWSNFDKELFGFCLEIYSYIRITSTFTPDQTTRGPVMPYEPFIMSLNTLSSYPTFGIMFGKLYGLFELVPQVSLLASQRLGEERSGTEFPSLDMLAIHNDLEARITKWGFPSQEASKGDTELLSQMTAAEAVRHGLHIYLLTSLAGSIVRDPLTLSNIRHHANSVVRNARLVVGSGSRYVTVLLWPVLIAGSCLLDSGERAELARDLKSSPFRMKHIHSICELLETLWATNQHDPQAFGPYGLYLMEKKGLYIPML